MSGYVRTIGGEKNEFAHSSHIFRKPNPHPFSTCLNRFEFLVRKRFFLCLAISIHQRGSKMQQDTSLFEMT